MPINTATWTAMLLRTAPDPYRVVQGNKSTTGLLDESDQYEATDGGGVDPVSDRVLTVARGSITLAKDSMVTLTRIGDNVSRTYRVLSQPMLAENGDLMRYSLTEAGQTP